MVNGQVPKDIILAKLQSSKSNFDLSTTGLVRLNDSKVSQDTIKVMMVPPPPVAVPVQVAPVSPPSPATLAVVPLTRATRKVAPAANPPSKKVDSLKKDSKAVPVKNPPTVD